MIRALSAASVMAASLIVLLAAGCGQKGPLKVPDSPAQPAQPTSPAQ